MAHASFILYIILALPMLCVLLNTLICETIVCQQALLGVRVGDGKRERELPLGTMSQEFGFYP